MARKKRKPDKRRKRTKKLIKQVLALREKQYTVAAIGETIGISTRYVSKLLRGRVKPLKGGQPVPPEIVETMVEMRRNRHTYPEIIKATGYSKTTVAKYVSHVNVPRQNRKGTTVPTAKLNSQVILDFIIPWLQEGRSQRWISRALKDMNIHVSAGTISRIQRGERWRHITKGHRLKPLVKSRSMDASMVSTALTLRRNHWPYRDIAEKLGVSDNSVIRALAQLDEDFPRVVSVKERRRLEAEQEKRIERDHEKVKQWAKRRREALKAKQAKKSA